MSEVFTIERNRVSKQVSNTDFDTYHRLKTDNERELFFTYINSSSSPTVLQGPTGLQDPIGDPGQSFLEIQEGGSHYKDLPIQPVQYIQANKIPFIEGNVIKYVTRHRSKNGAADIKKAIHFLNLLLEFDYPKEGTSE